MSGRHSRRAASAAALALCALALAVGAVLLGGCGASSGSPSNPAATGSAAAQPGSLTAAERAYLKQKGTLEVGAFNDYPPFGFVDASGKAAGIAVDYWNLVAERLGVAVTFTPVRFADQLDGLKTGRFDSLEGIFPLPDAPGGSPSQSPTSRSPRASTPSPAPPTSRRSRRSRAQRG